MVEPIKKPPPPTERERLADLEKGLAELLLDITQMNDPREQADLLLRFITASTRREQLAISLAVMAGIDEQAVLKATEIGTKLARDQMAAAHAAGGKEPS